MKPLSEIRKENREELTGFMEIICTPVHAKPSMKSFLSSAESRIIQAVVEKIDSLKDGFMCLECEHWNAALSDIKAYIEEGLK